MAVDLIAWKQPGLKMHEHALDWGSWWQLAISQILGYPAFLFTLLELLLLLAPLAHVDCNNSSMARVLSGWSPHIFCSEVMSFVSVPGQIPSQQRPETLAETSATLSSEARSWLDLVFQCEMQAQFNKHVETPWNLEINAASSFIRRTVLVLAVKPNQVIQNKLCNWIE